MSPRKCNAGHRAQHTVNSKCPINSEELFAYEPLPLHGTVTGGDRPVQARGDQRWSKKIHFPEAETRPGKALEFPPARDSGCSARRPLGPNALTPWSGARSPVFHGSLCPLRGPRLWLARPGRAHAGRVGADSKERAWGARRKGKETG